MAANDPVSTAEIRIETEISFAHSRKDMRLQVVV
jgi:hypothetical protein